VGATFWRDKCVIITGASSGIGAALAAHLAERGARLGLIARRREPLEQFAGGLGPQATVAVSPADVSDGASVRAAVADVEARLGPCDVLIANAGIHRYTPGYQFDADEAVAVLRTNLLGAVQTIGAVLPGMVERRRGHIVGVASIAAMLGLPDVAAYSASKAGLVTFLEGLRVDLHRFGVRVTTICPGFVDTPMIADHDRSQMRHVLPPGEAARRIARAIERGRCEYWFPWQTWLLARFGRALPVRLYTRLAQRYVGRAQRGRRPADVAPRPDS